ncbi:MAG: tetratricopeptide repeat protein [Rhodospirillales bacterium]|jgi:tetratricopeptide (TPR) repeat protein
MADPFLLSALRFLELGEELRRQGRLAEAVAAYRSVLDTCPDTGPAWMGLGLAAEGLGDIPTAGEAFAQAVRLDPKKVEAHLGLASALGAQGQQAGAIQAWLAARRLQPGDFRIHNIVWQALNEIEAEGLDYAGLVAKGNRLRQAGQATQALKAYRQAQDLAPGEPFAFSRAGCLLAKTGDLGAAEAEFAKTRALCDWVESGIRLAPEFFTALPAYRHRLDWRRQAAGDGALAVIGCDAGYFKRYAARLKESLDRHEGGTVGLHAHLVHPDAECLAQAQELGMGVSLEIPDFAGKSRNFINTYYASARFLALPELLAAYRRPLLVMDVDAQVQKPLAPLWDILKGRDMAIRRWQGVMVDPWNEPQANLVGVNPTPMGQAFAASLAQFLAHFAAKGQLFGFFDQTAIYSALKADPALAGLREGVFPQHAYGYPLNRGSAAEKLVFAPELLVGEVKTPWP